VADDCRSRRTHPASRHDDPLWETVKTVRLLGVELCRARVGSRDDGDPLGRKPAPELPEVGLNASHLWREVVCQKEVAHTGVSLRAQEQHARRMGAEPGVRSCGSGFEEGGGAKAGACRRAATRGRSSAGDSGVASGG
jgi:hypothetical protein